MSHPIKKNENKLQVLFRSIQQLRPYSYNRNSTMNNKTDKVNRSHSKLTDNYDYQLQQELKYYQDHSQLINNCVSKLQQIPTNQSSDGQLPKLIIILQQYAIKIVNLLTTYSQHLSNSTKKQSELQSKIALLRKENDKYFRYYEQKVEECEQLQTTIKQLRQTITNRNHQQQGDVIPLSLKNINIQLLNRSNITNKSKILSDININSRINQINTENQTKQSMRINCPSQYQNPIDLNQSMVEPPFYSSISKKQISHVKYFIDTNPIKGELDQNIETTTRNKSRIFTKKNKSKIKLN